MARRGRTPEQRRRRAADTALSVLRPAVLKRDDYRCAYCGSTRRKLRCDHVVPVSRGGLDTLQNLTTACDACDKLKGNMTGDEFRALPRCDDWLTTPGTRP